jgi:hypothetical protein
MSDQTICRPGLSPAELDDQAQLAVLHQLLLAYPAPFTLDEVVTALEEPFERSFEETDGIQRAVRDLVCAGLLQERDGLVLPTRATFRFSELVGL